jgi:hypothetical protein
MSTVHTRKGRVLPAVMWDAKPVGRAVGSPGTASCLCSEPDTRASASGTTPNSSAVLPRTCSRLKTGLRGSGFSRTALTQAQARRSRHQLLTAGHRRRVQAEEQAAAHRGDAQVVCNMSRQPRS